SVELDRVFVIGDEAALSAAEVNCSLGIVDRVERTHIPIAFGDLRDLLAVGAVVIDLAPAAAIAEPEKRSILQPLQSVIDDFNPSLGLFAKESARLTVIGIRRIQIEKSLFAILRLKPNLFTVRKP